MPATQTPCCIPTAKCCLRGLMLMLAISACVASCHREQAKPSLAAKHELFDRAWRWGRDDHLGGRPSDPARHWPRVAEVAPAGGYGWDAATLQHVMSEAYAEGYALHPEEEPDPAALNYDSWYRDGQLDAHAGKPPSPSTKGKAGYGDGYHGVRHRYGRPY